MGFVYTGSLDDSVKRNPWDGIHTNDFLEVVIRQVLTSDPIGVNDGYIFQSPWALADLQEADASLLVQLAEAGFLKVLCRTKKFEEMPERMSGIVATHSELAQSLGCKQAAARFGKAILDCDAYLSWPEVDIGYGFYLLCVAAYRMLRDPERAAGLGWDRTVHTLAISALAALIKAFHDKPVSIRGRLESEVIPKVVAEYKCKDELAAAFKSAMMGLANEFYHINFAALWSGEAGLALSVETRASPLFRGILESESTPSLIDPAALGTIFDLHIPASLPKERLKALLEFVTPGRGAHDAKRRFQDAEAGLLSGKVSLEERRDAARELNEAVYTVLYGKRDEAFARPVSRMLEIASEYSEMAVGGMEQLLSYVSGVGVDTGPATGEGVEVILAAGAAEAPSVVRGVGKLASARPTLSPAPRRGPSLVSLDLKQQPSRQFHSATAKAAEEFGTRFAIDDAELNER